MNVRVSCQNASRPSLAARDQNQPTRESHVQKKVDLRTRFRRIHTLQFMDLRASERTLPISHIDTTTEPPYTHLLPIREKAKRRCRRDAILTRTIESITTPKSTLTNATCCWLWLWPFDRASSSNTSSIVLHGGHVADVNIATTARWEPSRLGGGVVVGAGLVG
jgi:hypothetical protein